MKQCYSNVKRFFVSVPLVCLCLAGIAQTYTVTSVADDGSAGTLRDAITQVNLGLFNQINFNIAGAGTHTITLVSDLPTITTSVTIDGYSQPTSAAGPISSRTILIQIDGNHIATKGLDINISGVTVDGLAIYNIGNIVGPIAGAGINVQVAINNIFIWGNFIGTDATGLTTGLGNANQGVLVGVFNSASAANSGIIVGTNGDGTADANEGNLLVSNGGSSPGATDGGIVVFNTTSSKFSGNIIGLGKDAVTKTNLFNNGSGILLSDRSTSNIVGTNGDGVSDALERNFISNNALAGIWLFSKSNSNTISNNVIGLDASSGDAFNIGYGVNIDNSSNTLVGTNANGVSEMIKPNYISDNKSGGIQIKSGNIGPFQNQNADNNVVAGNFIGVALDGVTAAGNRADGITIISHTAPFTSNNNIIGSDGSGIGEQYKSNLIGFYSFNGITIDDLTNTTLAIGNRISKNRIFGNGTIGIDLINAGQVGTTGVTPNQANGFSTTGPNNLLNFPVITAASASNVTNKITISGFARPGAIIEFFVADRSATVPGPTAPLTKNFGQGKTFLFQAKQGGTLNGITDNGTNVAGSYNNTDEGMTSGTGPQPIITDFTFSFSVQAVSVGIVSGGTYTITAVAIDAGNTSGNANNTSAFGPDWDADFTALPITLIDFTGHGGEGRVYLNWSTSREVNNVAFYIQRSGDGSHFDNIGREAGSLTTEQIKTYSFTDDHPLDGTSFYRLKQVDIDGKFSYSKIIIIRNDVAKGSLKIFPSPFHENLNLSINATKAELLRVRIIDQTGRIVNSQQLRVSEGINSFNIGSNLRNINSGIFIIEVSGETIFYQQKLIRN